MRRNLLLSVLAGVLLIGGLRAQDPVFSQFYASPIQLNPAFAGVTLAPRLTFNYRNQYPNFPNAYTTYAASYEQAVEPLNIGFGFLLSNDVAGDGIYQTSNAAAVFGYQVRLNDQLVARFGLEGGLLQYRLDWDKLLFGDQIDPRNGPPSEVGAPVLSDEDRPERLSGTSFDVAAGVLLFSERWYGGVSVKHLNRPEESLLTINENLLVGRPLRLSTHFGAQFSLPGGNNRQMPTFISPNVLYIRQAEFSQLNLGAYAGFRQVFGGLWYRHAFSNPDAFILLAGFRKDIFRIGYSYDLTLSKLTAVPGGLGGTHEISVSIDFSNSRSLQRKRRADRWNDCFGMFR